MPTWLLSSSAECPLHKLPVWTPQPAIFAFQTAIPIFKRPIGEAISSVDVRERGADVYTLAADVLMSTGGSSPPV